RPAGSRGPALRVADCGHNRTDVKTPTRRDTMKPWKILLAATAAFAAVSGAWAQYPTRAIKLIVPFSAGGSTDIIARLTAEQMRKELGQAVVVENVGGAAGALGTLQVKSATPDGYALL